MADPVVETGRVNLLMETVANYCHQCGQMFELGVDGACPHHPLLQVPLEPLSQVQPTWGAGAGLLSWVASVGLMLGWQLVAIIVYVGSLMAQHKPMPAQSALQGDWLLVLLSLASVFPAHLMTLLICWLIVTARGQRPFWQSLGWGWHPQFKWVHAVALTALMLGVAVLFAKLLPHHETDMERMLKLGRSVQIVAGLLAALSAPVVEEVVYRGVLYGGLAHKWGTPVAVLGVTLLFGLVHVPQYFGSWAVISTIMCLSLVLTLLRAATGSVLPCVATHFLFNGIQAIQLLLGLDDSVKQQATEKALIWWTQWTALF